MIGSRLFSYDERSVYTRAVDRIFAHRKQDLQTPKAQAARGIRWQPPNNLKFREPYFFSSKFHTVFLQKHQPCLTRVIFLTKNFFVFNFGQNLSEEIASTCLLLAKALNILTFNS